MVSFGDFQPLCRNVPSYPWCNLFFRQLQSSSPSALLGLSADAASAPVGINPVCGILRVGTNGSLANIANMIACALSMVLVVGMILMTSRRKAAVGRVELRILLILYFLTLPLQLLSTGSLLQQGSTALTAITAVHAGLVAALFWALLANGIVATQVVEDGTASSVIPFGIFAALFFAATTYIALDVGFGFTRTFGPSNPPEALRSIPLFVLTSIWPGAAALIYLGLMTYIVLVVLNELRPMWFFALAGMLFVLAQLAWMLLGKVVCRGSSSRIDGSFIATLLETLAVVVLYLAWKSITEEDWVDEYRAPY